MSGVETTKSSMTDEPIDLAIVVLVHEAADLRILHELSKPREMNVHRVGGGTLKHRRELFVLAPLQIGQFGHPVHISRTRLSH